MSNMDFKFLEFNERRHQRGAEAARVEWIDGDDRGWVWMSKTDIGRNMMQFGRHPELIKALESYMQ